MSDKCGQPIVMKDGPPRSFITEEAAVRKLAVKLRKQLADKLPYTTVDDLQTLATSLDREVTGKKVIHAFLRAGGLPTLIGHLGGTSSVAVPSPSTYSDITASTPPNVQAAIAVLHELEDFVVDTATLLHPSFKTDLRIARLTVRAQAAYSLRALAMAQPAQLKTLAEAGVMGRLLELYMDLGDLPLANFTPESHATFFANRVAGLARLLMESEPIAAQELKQAISAPSVVQTFGAIAVLQVCMTISGGDLVGPLIDAGVADALVATLAHDSPYCVAAAAGVVGMIDHGPGRGKAAIEASGAVAALVRIVKRPPSQGDPKTETGLFRWVVFKATIDGENERPHFRNPTTMAVAGLFTIGPYSGTMLDSFLEAGGVPAVLRVLGESTCTVTLRYCLAIIQNLLGELHPPGTGSRSRELADELFRSGFCKAALQALESDNKGVRKFTMRIMATFLQSLSKHFFRAAVAALVAGNVVEVVMRDMDDEGENMHPSIMTLVMYFMTDSDGEKKMLAHGDADEPMDRSEDGALKNRKGVLRSHMHGGGKKRADSQPSPSGAAAPASTSRRTGASSTCFAASRTWTCSRCGVSSAELVGIGRLKECSGCRSVRYCGRACQMADWPAHKPICKRKQAAGK